MYELTPNGSFKVCLFIFYCQYVVHVSTLNSRATKKKSDSLKNKHYFYLINSLNYDCHTTSNRLGPTLSCKVKFGTHKKLNLSAMTNCKRKRRGDKNKESLKLCSEPMRMREDDIRGKGVKSRPL